MATPDPTAPGPAAAPVAEPTRVVLARVAAAAAASVPGVAALDGGAAGGWATAVDGGRVDGVRCVAATAGYDLALQVVARAVPLPALSDAIRAAVVQAATGAGLGAELGRIDVHVSRLAEEG